VCWCIAILVYQNILSINGVDADQFHADENQKQDFNAFPAKFITQDSILIGTVGRMEPVKDQLTADSSAMPTYRLCELARKNVTVAL
jgi:hypothetical protein